MDCPSCHQANLDGARYCAKCGALLPMHPADEADPLVGQIVGGRYRIAKVLGEGGMGKVYVGEQQMGTDVRNVAVKTLHAQYSQDPQIVARFQRECGTVSKLEHPNTIQFFDFGQAPTGQLYIAMELISGDSLAKVLEGGPLPPARVRKILEQISGSLAEAHGLGVIHRDLKPENIVLTTRAGQADFVKVLDFGIAKRSEAKDRAQEQKLTQQGMVLGTPPYMSPEQFTGKELDARSDVYSLGVMAYEMLTGRLPFDADTPWQWATQHMTAQPFPFEVTAASLAVPPAMKAAIMRALSKDREQRQGSVRQFFDELSSDSPAPAAVAGAPAAAPGRTPTVSMDSPVDSGGRGQTQMGQSPLYAAGAGAPPPAIVHEGYPTPMGGQSFPSQPQVAGAPAQAARPAGNKGLFIGLGAAAGVLLLVGVVVAARSMNKTSDPELTAPGGLGTPSGPVSVGFVPPEVPDAGAATPPPEKTAAPVVPGTTTVRHDAGTGAPTATATATATTPAVTGDAACAAAMTAARSHDVGGAAAAYRGCTGAGAGNARAAISREAATQVGYKLNNGDCAGAKAIMNQASAAGAGGEAAAAYAKKCAGK